MKPTLRNILSLFIFLSFYSGAIAQTYLTSELVTYNTCTGLIQDPGGPGFYNNNDYGWVSICPDAPGCITLDFLLLNLGSGDVLTIHDGPSIGDPILATYTSFDVAPINPIVGSNGCLTVEFQTDIVNSGQGFDLEVSCGPCASCTDGVQNGIESGVDCGGPNCPPCPCDNIGIAALPFSDNFGSTFFSGDNYGFADACGSFFMEGNDFVYTYTAPQDECLQWDLTNFPIGSAGMFLTDGCPDDALTNCLSSTEALGFQDALSGIYQATAGETIYFIVSSPAFLNQSIDYSFSLSTACPPIDDHDCLGAIPVCQEVYNVPLANIGAGVVPDGIDDFNSCLTQTESNSQWYNITISTAGDLAFDLQPGNGENFDWALYDITNFGCENIGTVSPLVSCNSYSNPFFNPGTGISDVLSGMGNSNGPNTNNGPSYNELLPVNQGQVFALYISNVQGGNNSFTLDFSESTAGVVDATAPAITGVTATCAGVFTVQFSEQVICADLNMADFTVSGPGGPYVVDSLSATCSFGEVLVNSVDLYLDVDIPLTGGDFDVTYMGGVTDLCANATPFYSETVTILPGADFNTTVIDTDCGFTNGEVTFIDVMGATPFQYFLNGIPSAGPTFTGLDEGNFTATLVDGDGCVYQEMVSVGLNLQDFTAGIDTVVCALDYILEGTLPAGFTGEWTSNGAVTYSDSSLANAVVSSANIGVYEMFWSIDNGGGCFRTDTLRVTLTDPMLNVQTTRESCPGDCDGSAEANFSGSYVGPPYTYDFSDGVVTADPSIYEDFCPGDYTVTVTDLDGCELTMPFTILDPIPFALDSLQETNETCLDDCDGFIEVLDVLAVSYSYDGGLTFAPSATSPDLCSGVYEVVAANLQGCLDTASAIISSPVPPIAEFTISPDVNTLFTPFFGTSNTSFNNVLNDWQVGEIEVIETSTEAEPYFLLDRAEAGEYLVQLIITDSLGCQDTTSTSITLVNEYNIYAPNAFTPDEDGVNDTWKPMVSDIKQEDYLLEIWDRTGLLVFETRDMDMPWTGVDFRNGNYAVNDGVYVWRVSGSLISSFDKREYVGTVTIVR